ncbi:alanine:cation symporter family protein [Porticoccaceae bacterium]|nr:alanine:cation symporter family protein [Porticoccaceae bacterium]
MSLDQQIDRLIKPLAEGLSDIVFYQISVFGQGFPLIVLWLVTAAVFFTGYLGFINIRGFSKAISLVSGTSGKANGPGEISHFQALSTAISGTVGVGNIGGVAVAISIGGPGAAFWLFMAGFLGMSTKFVECTLGVKYRRENLDGSVSGGPMYYLERYLLDRGFPKLGKLLGGFYALALVIGCFGIGNMFQSNQAYVQVLSISGGENSFFADKGWLFGLLLAGAVAAVIIGGIRSIGNVASKIVPFMAILYVFSAVIIIAMSAEHLISAIGLIVSNAFESQSMTGGGIGAMIIGFQRAVFSNEAGIGSASIAHAAVKTDEPVTEGLVSLLEPFIDSMLICTLTGLVIVTTAYPNGLMDGELEGIALTSAAFAHHISWSPYVMSIAALLFAFSTSIAWAYYGLKAWTYLFGEGEITQLIFKAIFCGFICLGCMIQLSAVLDFSDAMVFLIAVPNIIGLYLYGPEVKRDLKTYLAKYG